MNIHIPKQES